MSKTSELSVTVTELKRCGEALIGISESLAALFSSTDIGVLINTEARQFYYERKIKNAKNS